MRDARRSGWLAERPATRDLPCPQTRSLACDRATGADRTNETAMTQTARGLGDRRGLFASRTLIHRGGAEGIRTPDLLNAIQTRSQLRHGPKGWLTSGEQRRVYRRACALSTTCAAAGRHTPLPPGARLVTARTPGATLP